MYSDGIWNHLDLQRKHENNVSKACILTLFETIWISRFFLRKQRLSRMHSGGILTDWEMQILFKTMSLKHACMDYDGIWNDLELQGKAMKTMSLKHALWRLVLQGKPFAFDTQMVWYCREFFEIMPLNFLSGYSGGIWNNLEIQRKKHNQCF